MGVQISLWLERNHRIRGLVGFEVLWDFFPLPQ